ncbi:hypothetical protein [Streptomyces sp. NPDC051219]|uniref:hypothetical protein n=1 Tax=Streptomyces sp. NPDC051219 TaxID=3155283 RepID=UPI00342EBD31
MTATAWENLPHLIAVHGGFLRWQVRELRTLTGKKQTGARVAAAIEQQLAAHRIGHLPPTIPRDQNAEILLYNQDKFNIGLVLHLTRQLAEGKKDAGRTINDEVSMLDRALRMLVPPPKSDSAA